MQRPKKIIMTRNTTVNRLAHIRPTEKEEFQRATEIVRINNFRQGYILKHSLNMADEEVKKIKVHVPGTREEDCDLSNVVL